MDHTVWIIGDRFGQADLGRQIWADSSLPRPRVFNCMESHRVYHRELRTITVNVLPGTVNSQAH